MDNRGGKKTCKYYNACGSSDNCVRCKGYERRNPSQLPDNWRVGKYVPRSPYVNQIVATVDAMINSRTPTLSHTIPIPIH